MRCWKFSRRYFLTPTYLFKNYYFNNNCISALGPCYPRNAKVIPTYFHFFMYLSTPNGYPQTLLHVVLVHNECSDSQLKCFPPRVRGRCILILDSSRGLLMRRDAPFPASNAPPVLIILKITTFPQIERPFSMRGIKLFIHK